MKKKKQPNPGSDEAIAKGCRCPVLDNEHGRGYMCMKNVFVIVQGCPLHTKMGKWDTEKKEGGRRGRTAH